MAGKSNAVSQMELRNVEHLQEEVGVYKLEIYREGDTPASILPAHWRLFIVVAAQDRHDRSRSC